MANQVADVEFVAESVPFVVDIVFDQISPKDVQLIGLADHLHQCIIVLTHSR